MKDFNNLILTELTSNIGVGEFRLPAFFDKPIEIGEDMIKNISSQRLLIDDFFNTTKSIARQSLNLENKQINNILFSESYAGMDLKFHQNLPDCCWLNPVLYRTDQSISGKIYEIQAPGSGWGDIPLLVTIFQKAGYNLPNHILKFVDNYTKAIISVTKKDHPKVFHMLDAASAPVGMRYLLAQTRSIIKYWGLDKEVNMSDIDYITAHSAASLITSNFYNNYLSLAIEGKMRFGIPPNLLFDQKAIYVLPFYRETSSLFSDKVRNLFPFTSIIENDGFYDNNNQFISIKDFVKSKINRTYYLKYGGPNLNNNWGSRAVFRLSGKNCLKLLSDANERSKLGEVWLIQEDVSKDGLDNITNDLRDIIIKQKLHVKISAFHSCLETLGFKIMARKHFKVHGQVDTYTGIAI